MGPALNSEEIIRAAGAEFSGDTNIVFRGISTDSRSVAAGNLFVALAGEKFDGHDFLEDVLKKGAAGIVVRKDRQGKVQGLTQANIFRVDDTLKALGDIANFWRNRFTAPVIAITPPVKAPIALNIIPGPKRSFHLGGTDSSLKLLSLIEEANAPNKIPATNMNCQSIFTFSLVKYSLSSTCAGTKIFSINPAALTNVVEAPK